MTAPPALDDRRATLVAAGLVGAVVLVLGFGSGIGSVLSHDAASHRDSGGRDLGTEVQPDDVALGVAPPGSSPLDGARRISATTAVIAAPRVTPMTTTTAVSSTVSAPSGATVGSAASGTGGPACSSDGIAEAVLTPFLVHLDKAHLEESPGQQVGQALDLDQYVLTHTVMVEQMLAPILDLSETASSILSPFWVHVEKAHLEESPGEQVGQAADVDQYVETHTVMVEQMLVPVGTALTGTGCEG